LFCFVLSPEFEDRDSLTVDGKDSSVEVGFGISPLKTDSLVYMYPCCVAITETQGEGKGVVLVF